METFFAGLELQQIFMLGLGILLVSFIIKKLFKLAITIVVIIGVVYYGLPLLQTVMAK